MFLTRGKLRHSLQIFTNIFQFNFYFKIKQVKSWDTLFIYLVAFYIIDLLYESVKI